MCNYLLVRTIVLGLYLLTCNDNSTGAVFLSKKFRSNQLFSQSSSVAELSLISVSVFYNHIPKNLKENLE